MNVTEEIQGVGAIKAAIQAASQAANAELHATNAGTAAIWAPISEYIT